MNQAILQAIKESIAHWERMIKWAKEQKRSRPPSPDFMQDKIVEDWYGRDCALCKLYYIIGDDCLDDCPLYICKDHNSPWYKVDRSKTWGEWVKNANAMLKKLKSFLPKQRRKV